MRLRLRLKCRLFGHDWESVWSTQVSKFRAVYICRRCQLSGYSTP